MKRKLSFLFFVIFSLTILGNFSSNLFAEEEQFPFLSETNVKKVNVRAGQSVNFEKVAELIKGDEVVVVGKSYSWYKIKLPVHAKSFISKDYVQILGAGIGRVTGSRVNIRAGNGSQYSVVGQVKKDNWVKVLGSEDEWLRIEPLDQSYGYVSADFLSFKSKAIPPPRKVPPPTKNIYEIKRRKQADKARREAFEKKRAPKEEVKVPVKKMITRYQMTGVVESLGENALSNNIRHQLLIGGRTKCFLKGYRGIIDSFLHLKVKIEGELLSDEKAPYPVMLVTKINLVL